MEAVLPAKYLDITVCTAAQAARTGALTGLMSQGTWQRYGSFGISRTWLEQPRASMWKRLGPDSSLTVSGNPGA